MSNPKHTLTTFISVIIIALAFIVTLGLSAPGIAFAQSDELAPIDEPLQHSEEDIADLMARATGGEKEAQASLGLAYMIGNGVLQDEAEARYWIEKGAETREAYSLSILATFYRFSGTDEEKELEIPLRIEAADKGDRASQAYVGEAYYRGAIDGEPDYEKAGDYLLPAAEEFNPVAIYYLGLMSYFGRGVEEDKALGIEMIESAANLGHTDAQYDMAGIYEGGDTVEQDPEIALEWYLKAANKGHARAQWNAGMAYVMGEVVDKDPVKAVEWFLQSAAQDDTNGMNSLAVMYATGDGIQQDFEKAFNLYHKAALMGEGHGAKGIGTMYLLGQHVEADNYSAAVWFQIGALMGNEIAANALESNFTSRNSAEVMEGIRSQAVQWLEENQIPYN